MEKSAFTREYELFLKLLKRARKSAGLSQEDLAQRLEKDRRWISKCEVGERRLDLIDARAFCEAIGVPFVAFVEQLEAAIEEDRRRKGRNHPNGE